MGYKVANAEYAHPLISERAVDEPRPLRVIYIGAGISGICAAIQFPKFVPNLDLVIYEKNPDIGGTWYENRCVHIPLLTGRELLTPCNLDIQAVLAVCNKLNVRVISS